MKGIRGRAVSMCSQEEAEALLLAPPLFRSTVCSHNVLCAAVSFLARFLRPRALFPLSITTLCRVADRRRRVDKKSDSTSAVLSSLPTSFLEVR